MICSENWTPDCVDGTIFWSEMMAGGRGIPDDQKLIESSSYVHF